MDQKNGHRKQWRMFLHTFYNGSFSGTTTLSHVSHRRPWWVDGVLSYPEVSTEDSNLQGEECVSTESPECIWIIPSDRCGGCRIRRRNLEPELEALKGDFESAQVSTAKCSPWIPDLLCQCYLERHDLPPQSTTGEERTDPTERGRAAQESETTSMAASR